MSKNKKEEKFKVAVYGSLRKDLGNHGVLTQNDAKYIGTFQTKPIFSMYSLSAYPGLKLGGGTSITMEVYEVDRKGLDAVNALEGYSESENAVNNFYDRTKLVTPFGEAFTYIYQPSTSEKDLVESGDWKDYFMAHSVQELFKVQ